MQLVQLDIQFMSNLRLGIDHRDDPDQCIGIPERYSNQYESHVLRFERYVKLPTELKTLKEKLLKEAMNDKKRMQELRDEEMVNPWVITDLDFSLNGNPFCVSI